MKIETPEEFANRYWQSILSKDTGTHYTLADLVAARDAAIRKKAAEEGVKGLHKFLQKRLDNNTLRTITLGELKDAICAAIEGDAKMPHV